MTGIGRAGPARVRRAAWVALVVALATSLLAACGVGEDSEPELIARDNVPHDLLDPSPVSTTTPDAATRTVTVYLAETIEDTTRLRPARREVPAVTPEAVLEALFEPLTENERDRGVTSFLVPEQSGVLGVAESGARTLVVDLAEGTLNIQGAGLRVAFAQIVYTLTELDGVTRVLFRVEGTPRRAITADGTQSQSPVGRSAYRAYAPE